MDSLTKEDLETIRWVVGCSVHNANTRALDCYHNKDFDEKDYRREKAYAKKLEKLFHKVVKVMEEMK